MHETYVVRADTTPASYTLHFGVLVTCLHHVLHRFYKPYAVSILCSSPWSQDDGKLRYSERELMNGIGGGRYDGEMHQHNIRMYLK